MEGLWLCQVVFLALLGFAQGQQDSLVVEAPQPADSWTGVREATQESDVCIQMNPTLQGKEDCLFLNVYTPQLPVLAAKNTSLMPVMVWIHGGGFAWGSGNRKLQGPDYLMDENVVFVSLNYRLGAFGFLSLENKDAPGNAGLKDQVMALRWVRDNIKQFGGDPNDVTIFGQSSGAACVHYHMLSPISEGLFHRAISQSGSALSPWAYTRTARKVAFQLGVLLGKNTSEDAVLLDFLRGVSPEKIAEAAMGDLVPQEERDPLGYGPKFAPTKEEVYEDGEEVFLPGEPRELILEGKFEQVPHLIGTTTKDGYMVYSGKYFVLYWYDCQIL
ncbi:Venom carboxylesterase-6 [Blattella germanica]|nr:Venom carboxylesterase-6 [Blattella germanica]